jgi:CDGSH-type Zn-finger protein
MSQPTIASKAPAILELDAGTYFWCACGNSSKQPFCDGSHRGTEFRPKKFTLEENKKVFLCNCKQSDDAPFCNGTHRKL